MTKQSPVPCVPPEKAVAKRSAAESRSSAESQTRAEQERMHGVWRTEQNSLFRKINVLLRVKCRIGESTKRKPKTMDFRLHGNFKFILPEPGTAILRLIKHSGACTYRNCCMHACMVACWYYVTMHEVLGSFSNRLPKLVQSDNCHILKSWDTLFLL